MKHRVLYALLILILVFSLAVMTACKPQNDSCEHVDENGDGVCELCGEKFKEADPCEHVDENGDGVCELCGEKYKEPDPCEHVDENGDGVCELCGEKFKEPDPCEHVDENGDGVCELCGEKFKEPDPCEHVDENGDGVCELCGKKFKEPDPNFQYSITVNAGAGGTITVNKTTAKAGETVNVCATPASGYIYEVASLCVNGTPVEANTFVMPQMDVVITAQFVSEDTFPDSRCYVVTSTGGESAQANFFARYDTAGVHITTLVKDSNVTIKNKDFGYDDNIEFIISLQSNKVGLDINYCYKLLISAGGKYYLQKANSGTGFGAPSDLSLNIAPGSNFYFSVKELTYSDGVTGYRVDAYLGYDLLNTNYEQAYGNMTIVPALRNTNGDSTVWNSGTCLDAVWANPSKFIHILADGSFDKHPQIPVQAQTGPLGSGGGITAADTWDLSKDCYAADNENYPNRVVYLTDHDMADNNLVFKDVSAAEMYVEATIRVTGVANPNDQWPKFGLMLFNGSSQNGLFYYVDACMNSGSGNTTDNIIGTGLGYNKADGNWGSWLGLSSGTFDLNTLTIKMQMVFQNGWVHLYANDQYIESVYVGEYNENMRLGFKCFGLELEVTDYMASTDAQADGWENLKRDITSEANTIDILFLGDSYMEFWRSRYQNVHMSDYTDAYVNEGIGGTWVPLWIEKCTEMARLYNPASIVFHIGVNDIDGGATVDTTVANLKTLFETYHALFPNAKIYWNSLIPNTMFANKVPEYYQVNEQVLAYGEGTDWLVYIDQAASFEKEPGIANPIYFDDGLHLSSDIGYPLWVKNMLTAMGYNYEEGTTMGSENGFGHSGGWTYTDDTAYLGLSNEMITYFKDAVGEMVYVEAMVTIGNLLNNDGYPKFGYVVHGAEKSVWGLVDAVGYPGNENKGTAFVTRYIANNGWDYYTGWDWSTVQSGTFFEGGYSNNQYVKLAIAKLGNDIYLLCNDKVVAQTTLSGDVTIGFQVFNLEITIKDVVVIKDEATIKQKLDLV